MLTSQTDPRPPVEGQILPPALGVLLPPLRAERVRVIPPQVLPPVHREDVVPDDRVLLHVHRGPLVRAAADGERGVDHGDAEVERDRGVQAEGL